MAGTAQVQGASSSCADDNAIAVLSSGLEGSVKQASIAATKGPNSIDHAKQNDAENDPTAGNSRNGKKVPKGQSLASVAPAKEGSEVSSYEQARMQRMQENFEKLRSLGLSGGVADVLVVPAPTKKRPIKRKNANSPTAPLRRSTRSSTLCRLCIWE